MNSFMLEEVRQFERRAAASISGLQRPAYHLTAQAGWMNDPNGFSLYQGQYHMFYQYNPYASRWNTMYWGHAVSKDLLHWEYLPAALAPDRYYDQDGCFSGGAIDLPDGRQLLMYTAVRNEAQDGDPEKDVQTQCLAVGDGLNYEKYEGNPVLNENQLPAGGSRADFRDPHIVRLEDGTYQCFIANNDLRSGGGQILLYESPDAFHWHFVKVLIRNNDRFGKMWECPDFFPLDGFHVLLTSPQDMLPKGLEYHSGNNTLCLIGNYDHETRSFRELHDQSIDYGIDFYAPQTILTQDGRRIMIGWMQNWDAVAIREPKAPWAGQMSVPRELFIRDGRLYQRPLRELDALRTGEVSYENVSVSSLTELPGIRGRVADIELRVRGDADNMYHSFEMNFAQDEEYFTTLRFVPEDATLQIDRKFSGSRRAIIHQRRCHIDTDLCDLNLRILLDRNSVEIFIEDGRKVMTATMYTRLSADRITFEAHGTAEMDIKKYDLRM